MFEIRENVPLAPFTTLGIGGRARYFVNASSEGEVAEAMAFAARRETAVAVMGGGSNLLVSDAGFDGLILRVAIRSTEFADIGEAVVVTAGAGVDWDHLVAECVARNLAGIECLSGVPGWVGGTPVQNVGAYGQEVSNVISRVRCFDRQTSEIVDLDNAACGFGYRESIFNRKSRGRYIVLAVAYTLEPNGRPHVAYPDLRRAFEGGEGEPTLLGVRDAVLRIRRDKSMLIETGDPDSKSAGSFFRNPVVSDRTFHDLAEISSEPPPGFPAGAGKTKVPAAWLIERSGFGRGTRRLRVGLSTRHALALVNLGGATAADVISFAAEIQQGVASRFGVAIHPEPVFLGFAPDVVRRLGAISIPAARLS